MKLEAGMESMHSTFPLAYGAISHRYLVHESEKKMNSKIPRQMSIT